LPVLGTVVDWLSSSVQLLADFAATDLGRGFFQIAIAITAVVGGLALLAGAFTAGTAALSAFAFALDSIGIQGGVKGLFSLAAGFIGVGTGAGAGAIALNVFKVALAGTGIGLAVVALGTLAAAFMNASLSADQAFKNMISDTSGLATALQSDAAAYQAALASGNQALIDSFTVVDVSGQAASDTSNEFSSSVENMYDALDKIPPSLSEISNGFDDTTRVVGDATREWITNALLASEQFQQLFEDQKFSQWADGINLNLGVLIDKQAAGATEDELIQYLYGLQQQAIANGVEIPLMLGAGGAASAAGGSISELVKSIMGLSGAYYLAGTAADGLAGSAGNAADGIDDSGKAAASAAKKIYLLTDYANDLSSIWDRAFDIRFSGIESLDNISSSFAKIAESTADARDEIQGINADIESLTADRALQEYFLTVAEAYGDTLRAQSIRANLAKIDADLTKKTQSLQKAQDKTNKTLIGGSSAAIENRSEILDLVSSYQDHIKALAASGMGQEELRARAQQLKADFMAQATQLGYNVNELGLYAIAFDDVTAAIDAVPRDLTVDFNGDAALTAIDEFAAKAKDSLNGVSNTTITPDVDTTNADLKLRDWGSRVMNSVIYQARAATIANTLATTGILSNAGRAALEQELQDIKTMMGWASGGYTGNGGKYEVAGLVHRGEYVVPKEQVNQSTGLPYFMSQPRTFAQGGSTSAASGSTGNVVALSAGTIQAIAQAVQPMLFLDGQKISDASSAAYSNNTKVGAF